jgi:MFS family permease
MSHPAIQRYFSGLSKSTFLVTIGSLFADMSTEMLSPVLPIFLTQTLNANGSIVGLVDGVAQAIRNLVDGFSGSISDKLRKRKSIALVGYLLAAVAKPLMGLSPVWEGVLAGRLLDRLGAGIRSAPRDALVASSVNERHKGSGFGLEGFGDNAGAFLGPILTLFLLYELTLDIRAIFYLALIPGLLAFAMILPVGEQPRQVANSQVYVHARRFPVSYWKYLLATAIFGLGNSSNSFLILRIQDFGASVVAITLIYAGFNLIAALVSYPLGSLSDRWGRRTLLLGSYIVFLIVYFGLFLTESLAVIVTLFIVYGLYQGVFRSVGKALACDFVPDELRASGMGWYSATAGLCQLVASLVAGMLWDKVGHTSVFMYGVASAGCGIIALLLLVPRKRA